MTRGDQDDSGPFIPELKLTLIILSFGKLLFFIRIFEKYGFLVSMIQACLVDLIPFLITYWTFMCVIAICYISLNMEVDDEVDEAYGLGHFGKIVLETFRTAIGELAMPAFHAIVR